MTTEPMALEEAAEETPEETAPRKGRTRTRAASKSAKKGSSLVIVESPAKARTIARFLGPEYVVESSIGHVRDLPSSAAEIPAKLKGESWARLGVDIEHDFEPIYIVPASKKQQVTKHKALLKDADEVYLATDEDREGEAIAWHLREVLNPKVPVHRMVFHEITRPAIEAAIANPREIDENRVRAQEARRILDRLYGYEVSPVLWRKVRPRLSAGRVQSAAIRLVVARERARMRFVRASFWDVDAGLRTRDSERAEFPARLVELGGKRVASGRDFDPETGVLAGGDVALLDEAGARGVADAVTGATFTVASVQERPFTQRPPAPFITSTLQQEAARKMRFTAQRTMQVAQNLYENGYITYMRTDSTSLSTQAVDAARTQVRQLYGGEYLPEAPRTYAGARAAQEAHEAIRPAGEAFRTPDSLRGELESDAFRLYELVWMRTVASQMRDANGLRTNVRLEAPAGDAGTAVFATSGKVITFPGFLRAYVEGSDDPDAELEDQERVLPALAEGQQVDGERAEARGHETQPPARYTEASLIRELEERGIGRPSTYASILQTIQDRGYVWKRGTALVPTFVAFAVVNLLEAHFPELVDLDFTARMEDDLDAVAAGAVESIPWLQRFYFGDPNAKPADGALAAAGLKERIGSGWEDIDARAISSIPLGVDSEGRTVAVRVGRYGPYIQAGDEDVRANLADEVPPDELSLAHALELLSLAELGDQPLGDDPASGLPVYLKTGRYGPYVQLGSDEDVGEDGKPKRASLWPNMAPETLTLEQALMLLSYPKTLGTHPESGEPITAQDGPRGPYIKAGSESRSLRDHDHLATIGLTEALALLAEPRSGRGGRPGAASVLREVGEHPDSGAPITLRSGRFGPYVTDGVVNASLPKGRNPANVSIEEAVDLIAAREQRLREQGKDPRAAKPAGAKATAKRPRRTTTTRRSA